MLQNGIIQFVAVLLIFVLGMICGARLVYRVRHVTTKELHRALLNTLNLRTRELDQLRSDLQRPRRASAPESSERLERTDPPVPILRVFDGARMAHRLTPSGTDPFPINPEKTT